MSKELDDLGVMDMLKNQIALESEQGQCAQRLVEMMITIGLYNLHTEDLIVAEDEDGNIAKFTLRFCEELKNDG